MTADPTPAPRRRRTRAELERARAQSQRRFFAEIFRKYALTRLEYLILFYAQGGRCYVCRVADGTQKRLGVDHNHLTGEVRGLLCTGSLDAKTCNRLIEIRTPQGFARVLEQRGYRVTIEPNPLGPPARRILVPLRAGETVLPFLYKEGTFNINDVKGVDLDA